MRQLVQWLYRNVLAPIAFLGSFLFFYYAANVFKDTGRREEGMFDKVFDPLFKKMINTPIIGGLLYSDIVAVLWLGLITLFAIAIWWRHGIPHGEET